MLPLTTRRFASSEERVGGGGGAGGAPDLLQAPFHTSCGPRPVPIQSQPPPDPLTRHSMLAHWRNVLDRYASQC